jgi:hypothetical protein
VAASARPGPRPRGVRHSCGADGCWSTEFQSGVYMRGAAWATPAPHVPPATAAAATRTAPAGELKVRDRQSYEFALTSAAVALHIRGGLILDARAAAGRTWFTDGSKADERAYRDRGGPRVRLGAGLEPACAIGGDHVVRTVTDGTGHGTDASCSPVSRSAHRCHDTGSATDDLFGERVLRRILGAGADPPVSVRGRRSVCRYRPERSGKPAGRRPAPPARRVPWPRGPRRAPEICAWPLRSGSAGRAP